MSKKIENIDLILLKDISFEEFKSFHDSLDVERETWSLDFNVVYHKTEKAIQNIKEFYEQMCITIDSCRVAKIGEKIVGLVQCNWRAEDDSGFFQKVLNYIYE